MSDSRFNYFVSASVFILLFFLFQIYALQIGSVNESEKVIADQSSANYYFPSSRGNIYDRNGEILATTIRSFSLSLRPNLIKNKKNVTNKLVEIFSFKKEDIHKKIYSNSNFIWLKKDISPKEHLKINNLGEIGLQIHNEKRRIYPHGSITSHLVGFTNIDAVSYISFNFFLFTNPK